MEAMLTKLLNRERNLDERFFSKLKHFRRVATRYDKLADNFLAMVQLASMSLWPRANESTAWIENRYRMAQCADAVLLAALGGARGSPDSGGDGTYAVLVSDSPSSISARPAGPARLVRVFLPMRYRYN